MADRTRAAADSQQQPFHIVRFDTTLYSAGNLLSACSSSSKRVFVLAKDEHSARSKFLNEVEDCCGSLSHIDRQGEFGVSKLYFHISREGDEIPFYVDRSSSFLHEATEEECLRALSEWALSRSLDSPCDSFCELGLSTTCCIAEAEGYFTCRLPECIDCFSLTSVLEQHGLYDLETHRLSKISSSSEHNSVVLPLAKTIRDLFQTMLDEKKKEGSSMGVSSLLSTLEDTRFRAMTITVYDGNGEVWMDTSQPASGKLPAPPTQRQTDLFREVKRQAQKEGKEGAALLQAGVRLSMYRTCSPKGGEKDMAAIGACETKCGTYVVVCQACGSDVS